ncbi:hypothetical protein CR513_60488, partial [Mucuna pruriens]
MVEFNKKINELELDQKLKESLLNVWINSYLEETSEGLYDEEENVVIYQLDICTFEDGQDSKEDKMKKSSLKHEFLQQLSYLIQRTNKVEKEYNY